tara:strand:+ start:356 stop:583 length:228 start_codon:yes stop_codon:yes gene_type:complete
MYNLKGVTMRYQLNEPYEPSTSNELDPALRDLYSESLEEYYREEREYGADYDEMPDEMSECPEWVQEQIDEEIPF